MKEKLEILLKSNFALEEGSLLYGIRDESEFYLSEFNELIFTVVKCNELSLSVQERNLLSNSLWEFFFLILTSLYYDERENDIYNIRGINEKTKLALVKNLYYIGNHFSSGKTIELVDVLL